MNGLLLAAAIVTEVAATLSLRASDGLRKKRWALPILVSYAAAFGLLTLTLAAGTPVGIAYGIWAACGVALTAIAARIFFKDRLTKRMGAGVALVAVGVFLIQIGSTAHG
ncbi:DMT family transporter [Microbacterium sp. ZW T5_45]|uniref:DMT family transporter n=1 Tax=Microbacterium sp. ZW T5_45 TaxID=3378080 RepID=UPI00385291FF